MQQIVIKSYETKKSILTPIIFLVIGILLIVNPGEISEFISYIIGGVLIALGVSKIVYDRKRNHTTGDTFYSVTLIALGIIFIFFSGTIEFLVRLALGIWIIINGLNSIVIGANLMKLEKKSMVSLIIGFILLLMGIYTICVANLMFQTLGIVITIYAVLDIIDYIYIQIKNKG